MEFLDVGNFFQTVDIMGLNVNTNFEFFRQKTREILSFEVGPSSFTEPKSDLWSQFRQ